MLLRSSSTPIPGSLLPSYHESPKHNHHPELLNSSFPQRRRKKISVNQTGPKNAIAPSSPPRSKAPPPSKPQNPGLRRAQSEGNLDDLIAAAWSSFDGFSSPKKNQANQMVEKERLKVESHSRQRSMQVGHEDMGQSFSSKGQKGRNMLIDKDVDDFPSKMHLAKGLGAFTGGGIGGGLDECQRLGFGGDGVEEYYKKMVEENPGDALYLRNYAQFLHQAKGDLEGAEVYYSRAILMEPGDGDLLSQYAKLTWELHHDEERASSYFGRALQVAPGDSHVMAAYAGFLWETEDEDEACLAPAFNNISLKAF